MMMTLNPYISTEFVTLYDLNESVTIKDAFKTSVYMHEYTEDRFLLNLRYMLLKSPDFSLKYWISEILDTTFETSKVFHVTFPTNAYLLMKQTIPIIVLDAYQELMVPTLNYFSKVPDFDLSEPFICMNEKDINEAIVQDLADTIFGDCYSYNALFEDASESARMFNRMYPDSAFPCVSDDLECYETVDFDMLS